MIESRIMKRSPDDKKILLSIKKARVAPFGAEGNPVVLGCKGNDAAELNMAAELANDVNEAKNVNNRMTIE